MAEISDCHLVYLVNICSLIGWMLSIYRRKTWLEVNKRHFRFILTVTLPVIYSLCLVWSLEIQVYEIFNRSSPPLPATYRVLLSSNLIKSRPLKDAAGGEIDWKYCCQTSLWMAVHNYESFWYNQLQLPAKLKKARWTDDRRSWRVSSLIAFPFLPANPARFVCLWLEPAPRMHTHSTHTATRA